MLFRGYFLALNDSQEKRLRSLRGDPARRDFVSELEEEVRDAESTDKAWYLLFNCFRNSSTGGACADLEPVDLETINLVFLGGRRLHRADFYIINLIPKTTVSRVSKALHKVSLDLLRARYYNVNRGWFYPGDYKGTEQQLLYCWEWHTCIAAFFQRHEHGDRHILFSSQYQ